MNTDRSTNTVSQPNDEKPEKSNSYYFIDSIDLINSTPEELDAKLATIPAFQDPEIRKQAIKGVLDIRNKNSNKGSDSDSGAV